MLISCSLLLIFSSSLIGACEKESFLDSYSSFTSGNHSKWSHYIEQINDAWNNDAVQSSSSTNCGGLFSSVLEDDLSVWRERGGIEKDVFINAKSRGVHYQIIDHRLYRQPQCMFALRCKGVEHFILNIINELPNMELIINVFDYPKVGQ